MSEQKNIWFKRKRFGLGWDPVSWEGWAVVGAYGLGVAVVRAKRKKKGFLPSVPEVVLTAALVGVCCWKSE